MTKVIFEFIALFIIASFAYRTGFIAGADEEKFDRETANQRLRDCLQVVIQ